MQNDGVELDQIVSAGLGMPSYPVGTYPCHSLGDHIMGVVVLAWLTRYPVERWGDDWIRRGVIELRFRRHLMAGHALSLRRADENPSRTALAVSDEDGLVYAEGWTGIEDRRELARRIEISAQHEPVVPTKHSLAGRVLAPISFRFEVERDLAFAKTLSDYDYWRERRIAHPAWLGSAANALVRTRIDFEEGGIWLHAGLRIDLRAPVRDRAEIEIGGRVVELFDRARHRFAVCALEATVEGQPVASMRTTFVYGSISD